MLFYLQGCSLLLHLHANLNVEVFCLGGPGLVIFPVDIEFRFICVFHIVAFMLSVSLLIDARVDEVIVEFLCQVILALKVNHRACLALLAYEEE